MHARSPDSQDNRNLLARLNREQERVRDENEWMRPDVNAEAIARRTEEELRGRLGGAIPGNAVRALLPSNADPLAPLDPSRRALFTQHLAEIAARAALGREGFPDELLGTEPPTRGSESLSAGICAACRGSCCRSGGDHAYLTEETIARHLQADPDRTLAQILDSYL